MTYMVGPLIDFFVAGYPKCGTTSLYSYLNSHPGVFLPDLKEPHFFTEDYPGVREFTSELEYSALYHEATASQLLGDTSASVIHSDIALKRIIARFPHAKFIVLIRNPVRAARSFHGELLHNLNEDVEDVEMAWSLQSSRAEGRKIPSTCKEPRLLQYAEVFRYREHLPAFFDLVPEEQRLMLVFEEFFTEPKRGYRQVLDFLGLSDDGRTEFGVVNQARRHRFRFLAATHQRLVNDNGPVYQEIRAIMSRFRFHPSHILARFNRIAGGQPEISDSFAAELSDYFRPDVETAERLLGRKIEAWRD